ncbi:MAG: gluconolactonase, partial [candidate division NC10 bacterium]|nr:gluconolactonase [candidate division NC10 bacterium]
TNASGRLGFKVGQTAGVGLAKRELPTNCYRIDPNGRVDLVIAEAQLVPTEPEILPSASGRAGRLVGNRRTWCV